MANLGYATVQIIPSFKGVKAQTEKELDKELGGTGENAGKQAGGRFGKGILGTIGAVAGPLAAALGTVAVGAFLKDGIVAANQLAGGLREVVTLTGLTGSEANVAFAEFQGGVQSLSREVGIAQDVLTNGLYSAISAGVPRENAFTFLEVASKAAIAGVTDTNTAVDGLTTVINAFGLEATDASLVSDSLFTAVKGGKTTFEELSASLFNVGPAAASAGVSFQEVNAAIATLTAGGTPTSVATTQIRAALTGLQKPSKDLDAIFQQLGFQNAQLAIESEGLGFALNAVKDASGGNNGELQRLLGSTEAVAAANVLAGTGAEKFAAELAAQADAAGATAAAFDVIDQGRGLERLTVGLDNFKLAVGNAFLPAVNDIAGGIADTVLPSLETAATRLGGIIELLRTGDFNAAVSAALGGVAEDAPIVDQLLTVRDTIAGVFDTIGQIASTVGDIFGAAFAGLGEQALAVLPNLSPVGVIFQALLPVLPAIAGLLEQLAGVLGEVLGGVLESVGPLLQTIVDVLSQTFVAVMPAVLQLFTALGEVFVAILPSIQTLIGAIVPLVETLLTSLAPIIVQLVQTVLPPVIAIFTEIGAAIGPLVEILLALLVPAIEALMPVVETVFGVIVEIIGAALGVVQGIITAVTGALTGDWGKFWSGIGQILSGAWNLVISILKGALQIVISAVVGFIGLIQTRWSQFWGAIGSFFSGIWSGIVKGVSTGVTNIVRFFTELPGNVLKAVSSLAGKLLKFGGDMMRGFIDGVVNVGRGIADAVLGPIKGAVDGVKNFLGIRSPSRLFIGIGEDTGEGMAIGLERSAARVKKASEALRPTLVDYGPSNAALNLGTRRPGDDEPPAAGVGGVTIYQTNINPVAEPASVQTDKALQATGALADLGTV